MVLAVLFFALWLIWLGRQVAVAEAFAPARFEVDQW